MAEKRPRTRKVKQRNDPAPEYVLADVVRGLWGVPTRQHAALRTLLANGPYRVPPSLLKDLETGAFTRSNIAGTCWEIAQFLSGVVSRRSDSFGTLNRLSFRVHAAQPGDVVTIEIGTNAPHVLTKKEIKRGVEEIRHTLRDIAFVQIVALVYAAGLRRLRVCDAPVWRRSSVTGEHQFLPCGRLWVRVGKQKYCCRGCQKRVAMQNQRRRDREAKEAEAARRAHRGRRSR